MKIIYLLIILLSFTSLQAINIVNSDKPLKGEWNLKPEKIWSVSQAGNNIFARPNITIADNGTLYIHDYKKHQTYLFDKNGNYKKVFAKKGEGPGEIIFHLLSYSFDDGLMIADRTKIHYFSNNGNYKKKIEFKYPGQLPLFFTSSDTCITRTFGGTKGEMNIVDFKSGTKKTLKKYSLKDREFEFKNGLGLRMPGIHSEFIIGYDKNNKKIYYGINDTYLIHVTDLSGNKSNSFSVNSERKIVKKNVLKKTIKIMAPEVPLSEIKNFPNKLTYFNRIEIHNGLIYIYRANLGSYWQEQVIDIFSPDGKFLYRTIFKTGEDSDIYFPMLNNILIKNGHLYVLLENDEGDVSINKYKISLPQN